MLDLCIPHWERGLPLKTLYELMLLFSYVHLAFLNSDFPPVGEKTIVLYAVVISGIKGCMCLLPHESLGNRNPMPCCIGIVVMLM